MKTIYPLTVVVVLFLTSCGNTKSSDGATSEPPKQVGPTLTQKNITKDDYGREWPFTVDEGTLKCDQNGGVIFIANGKSYGVNGLAKSSEYSELEEIWAFDTSQTDELIKAGLSKEEAEEMKTRISIGPILEDGLKLCK